MEVRDSLVNISIIKVITIFTKMIINNNNNKVCDFTCEDVMMRKEITYIFILYHVKNINYLYLYIYT